MIKQIVRRLAFAFAVSFFGGLCGVNLAQASDVESIESKVLDSVIARAELSHHKYSYENFLVHITVNAIESLKISHGFVDHKPITLLQSLNGLPNGVLNFQDKIVYFETNDKFYSAGDSYFPNILLRLLSSKAEDVSKSYDIYTIGQSRVADLIVDMVKMVPVDGFGYNLLLAIDQESGIIVQLDVSDSSGSLVERFMSVNLKITDTNPKIIDETVAKLQKHSSWNTANPSNETLKWKLGWLPDNYAVVRTNRHAVFGSDASSEYMLISNKFTDISIYLTNHVADISVPVLTLNATTVYRQRISENLDIAVIGQIPPDMARSIAQSVVLE